MSEMNKKNWKALTAAVVLAVGFWGAPQGVWAATSVSGVGTTETFNVNSATASGKNATAVGDDANASSEASVAIGYGATVSDNTTEDGTKASIGGIAIGGAYYSQSRKDIEGAQVYAEGGIAIGSGSRVTVDAAYGIAIGRLASSIGFVGVAVGDDAFAGKYGVAIGSDANNFVIAGDYDYNEDRCRSIAIGWDATTYNSDAIALGSLASAYSSSIAIGFSAVAGVNRSEGLGAIAIGGNVVDYSGEKAVGLASAAKATASLGVALGSGTSVTAEKAVALGANSKVTASEGNVVSVGSSDTKNGFTRKIINVTAGSSKNDAANYGQLVKNTTYTASNGSVTIQNNANGTAFTINGLTDGVIKKDNTAAISGDTAYSYLNPTDGTFVKSGVSTATNLNALDSAMVKKEGEFAVDKDGKVTVLNNADGTAFTITGLSTADSNIVRVNETDSSQILVGRGDTYANVKTIDVSNGGTNYRKITGVAAGENTNDAANYGQLASNNNGNAYTMDENGYITVKTNANGDAFKLKITDVGAVAANNTGFVKGGDVYSYVSPTEDGTYVKTGASKTTAENLKALDTKIGKEIGVEGVYNATDDVETQISKVAAARIKADQYVSFDTGKNVITDAAGNTLVTFEQGAVASGNNNMVSGGQVWSNDINSTEAYTVQEDGSVTVKNNAGGTAFVINGIGTSSGTGLVIGDTDDRWVDLSWNSGDDVKRGTNSAAYGYKANASAENAVALGYNANASGMNSVALGSGSIASADNVISVGGGANVATRKIINVTAGSDATDAANYGQLVKNQEYKVAADGSVTIETNVADANGNKQAFKITGIGTGSADSDIVRVNENDSSQILVGRGDTYANVKTIDVSNGGTNYRKITGVAAGESTNDVANYGQLASNNNGNAYTMDENGYITVKTNANGDAFKLKITDVGAVAANNTGFVKGGDVYSYVSPTEDGTYVKTGASKTTAENLKALDTKIGKEIGVEGVYNATDDVETQISKVAAARIKADQYVSFDTGKNVITDAAGNTLVTFTQGTVSQNNQNMVSGGQVWSNDVAYDEYTMGSDGVITVKKNDTTDAFKLKISGNGTIEDGNAGLITGGTAYAYLNPTDGTFVKSGVSTATNLNALDSAMVKKKGEFAVDKDGKVTVLNNADGTAFTITGLSTADSNIVRVNETDSSQILVGRGDTYANVKTIDVSNGGTNYRKITGVAAGENTNDAANYGQLASNNNGNAYTMDENGYITVKTNANGDAFKLKISGNGAITENNAALITGDTAYTYLNPTDGTFVKSGVNTATNLNALDSAMVKKKGEFAVDKDGKVTVLNNADGTAFTITGLSTADSNIVRVNENESSQILVGRGDTYANVKTIDVSNGGTNYRKITGVAAGTNTNDVATYGQLVNAQAIKDKSGNITGYKPYEFATDGTVTVNNNAGGTAFVLKLTNNTIDGKEETGTGYVTNQAMYTELRPTDGNYVKQANTTAANLNALDTQVKTNTENIETNTKNIKTNTDNITKLDTRVTTIENNITNIDSKIDTKIDAVTLENKTYTFSKDYAEQAITYKDNGGTAFTIKIDGLSDGGNSITYTAGQGIAIDTKDNISTISVKVDGSDLTVSDEGLAVKKDGKVENGNEGLVTGGTVYDAMKSMDNQVAQLSDDINKVGAGAAALAALHPEAYDPNDKWSFAVGYGHYKGANAGALGAFFKPNVDTTVSMASTVGNGDTMMNMGVSFKLGNKGKKAGTYRSAVDLVDRIYALEVSMAREIQRNDSQDSIIELQAKALLELKADVARMQQQIANLLSDAGMAIR